MADFLNLRIGNTRWGLPVGTPAFQNHTVSDSTSGISFIFQALNANPITHVGYRYGARTGTPPTYVATLEGVSASTGNPDGTDVGGGSPTAVTFTPPADTSIDGLWQWVALTNAYTPTRGQLLCFTIRYSSGTVNGSNCSSFTTDVNNVLSVVNFPYSSRLTTGTWAGRSNAPAGGIRTASERYGMVIESLYTTRSASTVGHRRAIKFTLPSGAGSSFTIRGIRFMGSIAAAAGKNPICGLWSAGATLQTYTLDSDVVVSAASGSYRLYDVLFDESTLSTLSHGTAYYIGLEVADATNGGVFISGIGVNNASDMSAFAGSTSFCLSSYDGSSWTDDTLTRPFAELIVDDWTVPSGSSGGYVIGS